MAKKTRGNAANSSWSMDDPSIRRQSDLSDHPDRGLESVNSETLGTDVYPDQRKEGLYTQGPANMLGSTEEEGGATTKDEVARDIPIGPGNRKIVTSGASERHRKRQQDIESV